MHPFLSPLRLSELNSKVKVDSLNVRIATRRCISIPHQVSQEVEHSLVKRVLAQLTSNARLLIPAKWHIRVKGVDTIDPQRASVKLVCRLDGSSDVLGEHGRSKTVHGVIGLADDICEASLLQKNAFSFLM